MTTDLAALVAELEEMVDWFARQTCDAAARADCSTCAMSQTLRDVLSLLTAEPERPETPLGGICWCRKNPCVCDLHDSQCERELTSHGYTPCRCDERAGAEPEPRPQEEQR
jgi:hypothetical protein